MKRILLGIAAVAMLCTTAASAADLVTKSPAPPYSWTGAYFGVNAGGHWGQDSDPAYVSFNNNYTRDNVAILNQAAPVTLDPAGFAGGVQAGYNWQINRLVVGVEADIDALTGTGSRNIVVNEIVCCTTANFMDSARDRWMSTLRARAGVLATERTLLYATGGVAWSGWTLGHGFVDSSTLPEGAVTTSATRTGWTVGGGLEYALADYWHIRVEYLYANFGTVNQTLNLPVTGFVIPFLTTFAEPNKLSENIARVGISYQFH
jgi:outer membrane immunogenic protein